MVNLILISVLLICVYTDLKSRKILNVVTLPAILIGFLIYSVGGGLEGFLFSGKGFLVGLGLLLIPFLLGGIGAGDVKLLAAIGSLKGSLFVLNSFLYCAVFGGVIALIILIRRGQLSDFFKRLFYSIILLKATNGSMNLNKEDDLAPTFPYGIAIALGTAFTYLIGGLV